MSYFDSTFNNGIFSEYDRASRFLNNEIIEASKKKHEKTLDDMWRIYSSGAVAQLVEYNKMVGIIKSVGLKVMRNSEGRHKIVRK